MQSYARIIMSYGRLKTKTFNNFGFSAEGSLISASAVPIQNTFFFQDGSRLIHSCKERRRATEEYLESCRASTLSHFPQTAVKPTTSDLAHCLATH